MHIVECYVPALVNLLVLVLLANVMLGLGYWMSQDLPFFAFLHTALVFVELSKWASTEPARGALTHLVGWHTTFPLSSSHLVGWHNPPVSRALTWLVATCAPPTFVRTALASARRAPRLACQPALAPNLDGCGGRCGCPTILVLPSLKMVRVEDQERDHWRCSGLSQDILVGWYWSPAQVCALWQR